MNIQVDRSGFESAMKLMTAVAPRLGSAVKAMQSNVLLRPDPNHADRLELCATDGECYVTASVPAELSGKGNGAAVDAERLSRVAAQCHDATLALDLGAKHLTITDADGEFEMNRFDPKDFSTMPAVGTSDKPLTVDAKSFATAVGHASTFAAKESSRFTINGVHLYSNGKSKGVVVEATDGRRAVRIAVEATRGVNVVDVLVPVKAMKLLARVVSVMGPETIRIEASATMIEFCTDSVRIVSSLLDGNFPDMSQVIPSSASFTGTFDTAEFRDAIKRSDMFTPADEGSHGVTFNPCDEGIELSAADPERGKARVVCALKRSGTETMPAFRCNAAFLEQAIPPDQTVGTIRICDPNKPIVITNCSDDYTAVVMPIQK